jgi:hypothetical protein
MEYIAPSTDGSAWHPDVLVVTTVRRKSSIGRTAQP